MIKEMINKLTKGEKIAVILSIISIFDLVLYCLTLDYEFMANASFSIIIAAIIIVYEEIKNLKKEIENLKKF